ncbi:MAG TPA: universal stress protein [Solirubrobacteraceae bacterium]|nr:universal stress protein [Solirubrobacteraceae bacterium]
MYGNILIGIKGDPDDDRRAIELARRVASPESRLTLVHVSVVTPFGSEREGLELELDAPEERTHVFAEQLALAGEGTHLLREHAPSVGRGLQAAAERVDADLLVLGSTRHRGLERLLEGDDVEATLARTRCAVAIADGAGTHGLDPIRTIGVAYDATPDAVAAVEHARALATALGARLTPLYVAAPHVYATGFGMVAYPVEDPEAVVKAARTNMGTVAGEPVKVIYGDPTWELEKFTERVDLLVCGSRRQHTVRRLVFGSTTTSLSRNAHCPLIVAPPVATVRPAEPSTTASAPAA